MEADHRTIAGLFVADRLDHLLNKTNGILKKLEEGYTVICDRYYFSSYAYHGAHMSQQWVIEANSMSADLLKPDLNIYIDIDPEVSLNRISRNRQGVELYETLYNLVKVREMYFEAFENQNKYENIFITQGNRQPEIIAQEIWGEIAKMV
jgi:dTMP kinase